MTVAQVKISKFCEFFQPAPLFKRDSDEDVSLWIFFWEMFQTITLSKKWRTPRNTSFVEHLQTAASNDVNMVRFFCNFYYSLKWKLKGFQRKLLRKNVYPSFYFFDESKDNDDRVTSIWTCSNIKTRFSKNTGF